MLLLPNEEELSQRLQQRQVQGHFAGPSLLASQLAALEFDPHARQGSGHDIFMAVCQQPGQPYPSTHHVVQLVLQRLGGNTLPGSPQRSARTGFQLAQQLPAR